MTIAKRILLTVLLAAAGVAAQNITANQVTANRLTLLPTGAPAQVSVTLTQSVPGTATYYYWVVATNAVGSVMSGPFKIANAPNPMNSSNFVTASWFPGPDTVYSLLRTNASISPTGSCTCAITISSTNTFVSDFGSLQAYTIPTLLAPSELTSSSAQVNDIISKGPWLDVRAFGASGSNEATTATCIAGLSTVSLGSAEDFADGQGVSLSGCGVPAFGGASITAPQPTVINWCGTGGQMACGSAPGSTTYNYKIVVDDGAEGYTAAGAAGTTATGAATLGTSCCNSVVGANYLTWSAPAGITGNGYGYFVYAQQSAGAWRLTGIVTIPGYALPWQKTTAYPNGRYVTPAASPNGSYYVAITGGTSGASEPTWCTSSPTCSFSDGSVTWQRQPFAWMDTGQTVTYAPGWVPSAPPSSAASDALVSTIVAVGGGTLTLAAPPATSAPSAAITHDDTGAINAAAAAQAASCLFRQPVGSAPNAVCKPLWFPAGVYQVSGPLNFGSYLYVQGNAHARLAGQEPFQPLFYSTSAESITLADIHTDGGLDALKVLSAASDDSTFSIQRVDVRYATDYALSLGTLEGGASGISADGLSASMQGNFYWDRMLLYCGGDWCQFGPNTWVEPGPANTAPYQAHVWAASGTSVALHGVVGVPATLPYDRWIDDWGATSIIVDGNTRLGGEGGGISPVYFLGGYGASQAFNWPLATAGLGVPFNHLGSSVTIRDSMVSQGNAGLITTLNNSFPQQFVVNGAYWGINSPLVDTCSGVNVKGGVNEPCALVAGFSPTNLDTVFEGALGGAYTVRLDISGGSNLAYYCQASNIQQSLLPFLQDPHCLMTAAAPTAGIWTAGGTSGDGFSPLLLNLLPASGSPLGWLLASQGGSFGIPERAAPTWQASHGYTLATSSLGEGDDFVTDGSGHSFYVSAVSTGSTCTSGGSTPIWNTSVNSSTGVGGTTADGTCTWTIEAVGSSASNTPGYVAPFSALTAAAFVTVGDLTGSVTGSTANVPANSCGDLVIATVKGATTAMVPHASISGSFPTTGLVLQSTIVSDGTVSVEYCNVTTTGIVPAAATINVRVSQ